MLPDTDFPQKNFTYVYAPGFDLPVHKTQTEDGQPMVISKWKLSKEDLDFINSHGYIYLSIIGGQPPVNLLAEPVFENEG